MNINDMIHYRSAIWDGNNLAWRYMRKPFITFSHNGKKTGVIFGVINSVLALKKRYSIKNICVCWDDKINKRKDEDQSYKANRKSGRYDDGNELGTQIETLHNNLSRFGILSLRSEGMEADDLCYTAAKIIGENLKKDQRALLISRDHDFEQIVDSVGADKVHLLVPGSSAKQDLIIENGLDYSFIVYHALVGDSVDNIKGIPRFSTKVALELAKKYESVEAMLKHESDTKIQEHKEKLLLNKSMLTVKDDPTIEIGTPKEDREAIKEFCQYYGLKKIFETNYGTEKQAEMFGGLA